MKNDCPSKIVFLSLIAGRKQKDALLAALSGSGVKLTNVVYGRGTVKASYLMNTLGLVAEEHKVVIVGLMAAEKTSAVLEMLVEKFHFDKPNTGVAFTVPIEKLSF